MVLDLQEQPFSGRSSASLLRGPSPAIAAAAIIAPPTVCEIQLLVSAITRLSSTYSRQVGRMIARSARAARAAALHRPDRRRAGRRRALLPTRVDPPDSRCAGRAPRTRAAPTSATRDLEQCAARGSRGFSVEEGDGRVAADSLSRDSGHRSSRGATEADTRDPAAEDITTMRERAGRAFGASAICRKAVSIIVVAGSCR